MPFWLVCILHMELSFLVCVVNEFFVSKHHHHHHLQKLVHFFVPTKYPFFVGYCSEKVRRFRT
jgi:hypothetical protein